ncbi:MAG: Coenzyme F420 hydrogenase/dehydrogenase, beta subunit C-terminal domain [Lachnospiraceae bacterium]
MIQIQDKKSCCGCGGCMNRCPQNCITMQADTEGFLYPVIDTDQCISCGLCEMVCPVLHAKPDTELEQKAYVVQIKDEKIRRESTSGGAFSAISHYVLNRGGIVFGAAYNNHFEVEHVSISNEAELKRLRNSKYVQSDIGKTFAEAEQILKMGTFVCYSGTPCQIEGLKQYLGKEYNNLITVDVVCHAVPSPSVWKTYLEMQKIKYGTDISNILFRDKHYGYQYSTMTLKDSTGKEVYTYGIDTDPMLRAFFANICDRPSCYDCKFKKRYRVSDFTIWDCYPVYEFDKRLDDDKGTTRVLLHSSKAQMIFQEIKDSLRYTEVSADQLTAGVKEMYQSVSENPRRKEFFKDMDAMSGEELFHKYFPETIAVKLERSARIFCFQSGIYRIAKRAAKKILKR